MDPKLLIPDPVDSAMNFHPMFVHFPVALLPVTLAFLLLARWRNSERLLFTAKVCLIAGALGALAAVTSGWMAADSIPHNDVIHRMMETHEAAAITVLSIAVALAVWSRWISLQNRGSFRWFAGMLILVNGLLVCVGDLGARMVYQQGAGVIPAAPLIRGDPPETNDEATSPPAGHQAPDQDQ